MLFLSRSALESYQTCPRLYFITYQLFGTGIVGVRSSLDLVDGGARHKGVEVMNLGGSLEEAVKEADRFFVDNTKFGIEDVSDSHAGLVAQEHRAIIEAGLRVWTAVRLPSIREKYTVMEVEKERSYQLRPNIIFEGRPDADLQSKENMRMFAYSLKNPRQYWASRHPECMVDLQGRTEAWLLGNVYGHDNIGGVMMDYIMTGKESDSDSEEKADGVTFEIVDAPVIGTPKFRWTPLVRGWAKDMPDGSRQFAWRYKYDNPLYNAFAPRSKENTKTKSFTQSKRTVAWEYHGGVKGWVDDLLANKFVPTNKSPIDDVLYAPEPYYRPQQQVVSFLFKLVRLAETIEADLAQLSKPELSDPKLHSLFPQYETSCINRYGKKCRAWEICHGAGGNAPLSNGFKIREPHHVLEAEFVKDASVVSVVASPRMPTLPSVNQADLYWKHTLKKSAPVRRYQQSKTRGGQK